MPLLIDGNSATGQALAQKQQRVASTINLAAQIFTGILAGLAQQGLKPSQNELAPLAQDALIAAGAFHIVADGYATAELNPAPPAPKPLVELEG